MILYVWMQVIILWRRDKLKLSFDSLEGGWFSSGDALEQSRQRLFHVIDSRLHSADMLPFVVQLPQEFIDEHAKVCYSRNVDCTITELLYYVGNNHVAIELLRAEVRRYQNMISGTSLIIEAAFDWQV